MGILFNVLFIYPLRRLFANRNADWRARKDAGERVFPLKPDTVFIMALIGICIIGSVIFD